MRTAVAEVIGGNVRDDESGAASTVSETSVDTRPSACTVVVVMRVVFFPFIMIVSVFLDVPGCCVVCCARGAHPALDPKVLSNASKRDGRGC